MLVDTHCHLDYPVFDADRDEVLDRAGDIVIVNSTVDPDLVEKGLGLAERYRNVYCTLGVNASEQDSRIIQQMITLIRERRSNIVGVGEAGLDYHWVKDDAGRKAGVENFRRILDLSLEIGLPLVVHSREAESDCINILRERKVRAIMHCFSGTVEEAYSAVELGCLISIPADVTYSRRRQRLVEALPLSSMVLETDAPYLAPERGKRNEPVNVKAAAEKIAEVKGVGLAAVEDATTENALEFFRIKW